MLKGLTRTVGWFALAYLGYWLAQAIDRILVQAVAYPLLGLEVTHWFITPFRVTIENNMPEGFHGHFAVLIAPALVLQVAFLGALARWGVRFRSAFLRIFLHFAGVWVVLLLATQVGLFAYRGLLRFGGWYTLATSGGLDGLPVRILIVALVSLLLLALGGMCAGRLISELRNSGLAGESRTWLAVLFLILPVFVILAGTFGFVWPAFGPRAILRLLVPAVFCLLLALIGLWHKPVPARAAGLADSAAILALSISAVFYGGVLQAPRVRVWFAEQEMARFASPHYDIRYEANRFSTEFVAAFSADREQVLARLASRIQAPTEGLRLRIVLYPDFASRHTSPGGTRPWVVEGKTVHAVLAGYIERLDPAADAAALLGAAWGAPGTLLMRDWVAQWLVGQWRGRSLEEWAGQIQGEEGHLSLAQLLEGTSDGELSPLVRTPLGAAWIQLVFDRLGLSGVRQLYSASQRELNPATLAARFGVAPASLEQEWQQWTVRLASTLAADALWRRPIEASLFFRGISFSHEGWISGQAGYFSEEAAKELRRLRGMGANAIAVVPYGFVRDGADLTISYAGTDETNEELIQALHVAHGLGIKVMLKPQIWVGGGRFTGGIRSDDPAVRANWMRSYRAFILHYARLAELEQFDLLCVGNELEGVTRYEQDWRRLIAEVRRVYHGPITYAANWGREFESLPFWDALDYAGVNNYYPLLVPSAAEGAAATSRAAHLLPGAQALAVKLERFHQKWYKPILFTEVGYPSVRGAAAQPWVEDPARGISLEEQAACYEATFEAFADRPWLRGMFWWKWPSSGRGGGPRDGSYTPLGKPAAEVLRAWYTRLASRRKTGSTQAP